MALAGDMRLYDHAVEMKEGEIKVLIIYKVAFNVYGVIKIASYSYNVKLLAA